jgi:ATP-dependent Clp protease ATP-binding subunit ClpB
MDDCRLTDGQGRTVDFKNTVLIMTSNIPVGEPPVDRSDAGASAAADAWVRSQLLQYFKPEFINRLDDIVRFHALTREQISEIVDLQVAQVLARVAERGVEVTVTPAARELLGDMGYDPAYGARPLRRGRSGWSRPPAARAPKARGRSRRPRPVVKRSCRRATRSSARSRRSSVHLSR